MPHPQITHQTEQLLEKKFFDQMFCLESDKKTFTFYVIISNSIPNKATFVKEAFDSMVSLESDKLTALSPNDSLTFTFYVTFSNYTPN